ncbi:MAG: hypothetical protein VKN72_28440 [Nostocales cyanobacterium 94392]|nr:hypothetical protein [Nostocales cyanobacterium 94392]
MSDFKIVHHKQESNAVHTIDELSKHYIINGGLIINKPLPSNFYSYWTVELDNIDEDKNKTILSLMRQLNHIFYVAISHGVYTDDKFLEFLKELNKKFTNYNNKWKPIRDCLLRDFYDIKEVSQLFKNFCSVVLWILDVKYLDFTYFKNDKNIREIKERSIRKQFVYEYMLDEYVSNTSFQGIEIKSCFLLPYCSETKKEGEKILDGYISLIYLNFKSVSKIYSSS